MSARGNPGFYAKAISKQKSDRQKRQTRADLALNGTLDFGRYSKLGLILPRLSSLRSKKTAIFEARESLLRF